MFSSTKSVLASPSRSLRSATNRRKPSLAIEALEKRDLMSASISFDSATGVLTLDGDEHNEVAIVSEAFGDIKATMNSGAVTYQKTVSAASVSKIVFDGHDGNDEFTNGTSKPARAYGGSGDDHLVGGAANEVFYGEAGNDTVVGNGGNDWLVGGNDNDLMYGGDGKDTMFGAAGKDKMYGGANNDFMYGGAGNDLLYGETGSDVIVTIGGGTDLIWGGSESDNVWKDSSDLMVDITQHEINHRYIHNIGNFVGYSYDGGEHVIPVSKELNGQALLDPEAIKPKDGDPEPVLQNFSTKPLFASDGPTEDDVFQGNTGDCFFMARLSAAAKMNPEFVRKMVVDLGDGTYAVRFFRYGQPQYVRVDADLYVNPDTNKLEYAKLGHQNSIWVPIVEKAYAFWREQQGNYDSISGGGGNKVEHVSKELFGGQVVRDQRTPVTAQQVIDWVAAGRPNGGVSGNIHFAVTGFLNWIATELAAGNAVVVGAKYGLSDTMALNESTWRRGQHIITVDHVLVDANGHPTGLVYRNPYGVEGPNHDGYVTVTDFARIYYCIGSGGSAKV